MTILIFPVRAGFVTNLARSFVRLMFQAMWADVGVSSRKATPGGVAKPACAGIILAARGVKQLLQLVDNWHNFLLDYMESWNRWNQRNRWGPLLWSGNYGTPC